MVGADRPPVRFPTNFARVSTQLANYKLFHQLDGWLVRRIWSHRFGKWRCCGWTTLPRRKLYGEFGLVNLVALIPSIATERRASS